MDSTTFSKTTVINSIGAIYLSNCFSMFATGLVITKVIDYYSLFPNDRLLFKIIVGSMCVLSLGETAGYLALGWNWAVANYGDISAIAVVPRFFALITLCWSLATIINQMFYAWRLFLIGRNPYILAFIATGTTYQFGFLLYNLSPDFTGKVLVSELSGTLHAPAYVWIAVDVCVDLTITSGMFYYLGYRRRSNAAGNDTTEKLLQGILNRTVSYNALSLTVMCIEYGFFLTTRKNGMWFGLGNSILVKVFTFSIIMSLIARNKDGASFPHASVSASTGVISSVKPPIPAHSGVKVVIETSRSVQVESVQRDLGGARTVPVRFENLDEKDSEKFDPESIELTDIV